MHALQHMAGVAANRPHRLAVTIALAACLVIASASRAAPDLNSLTSPIIFRGTATTAFRDPAAIYHDGWFYLFLSINNVEADGQTFQYTAWSKSRDLARWTPPKIFTPRDKSLNFSSPGDVIRFGDDWILCLQTYPRPNGERYGNAASRIWIMRSKDLENWGAAELLRVKGPDTPVEQMGRMIDPFLLQDKDDPAKWWCLFKQKGVSYSWSNDLQHWTFAGSTPAGENTCVIVADSQYVLFHSPTNGIGVKRSSDLKTWRDEGTLTLGQAQWAWAKGRITAGFVLDGRKIPGVEKYLMFFHGSEYPETDPRGGFDTFASVGIAWSSDLKQWQWPADPR